MNIEFFELLESAIRSDAAGRGLLARPADRANWQKGHLQPAVQSLVERGREIAIVTGFAIPMPGGPVGETDGPPGAVMLADVLVSLGRSVTLVTDEICEPVVQTAAESAGLGDVRVEACPVAHAAATDWLAEFQSKNCSLTHVVAIERVGPGHSPETLNEQQRSGPPPVAEFRRLVNPSHFGQCHNMRGEVIDGITAPLHRLFESTRKSGRSPESIGIGDGGNEIGMGSIPWEEIASRLAGEQAPRIPCSIATNWTILCGVSNWGALALMAGVAKALNRPELALKWTVARQQELLDAIVRNGGAVDGAARLHQPTVDGLSQDQYFEPWRMIERRLAQP